MNRPPARLFIVVIMALVLSGLFASCGDSGDRAKPAPDPEASGSVSEDEIGEKFARAKKKHPGKERQRRKKMTRLRANNPPMVLIRTAMNRLDISDEQRKKIRALMRVTRPNRDQKNAAQMNLKKDLAAAVEKGKIDSSIFEGVYDTSSRTNAMLLEERSKNLESLHRMLTAEQRVTLAKIVREEVAQVASATSNASDGGMNAKRRGKDGKASRRGKRGPAIGKMMRQLDLSVEQRSEISRIEQQIAEEIAAETPRDETGGMPLHTRTIALTELFEKSEFKAADWKPIKAKTPEQRSTDIERRASRVQKLVDVLTEKQRGELAGLLRNTKKKQRAARPVVIKKKAR